MEIILGYACLNTSIPNKMRSLRLSTYNKKGNEYLKSLVLNNLNYTKACLEWNIKNKVHFFRISSDLVPLATHEEMSFKWYDDEDIRNLTLDIQRTARKNDIRLSMHPGQYTILNSPKIDVVNRSIEDLKYHQIIGELMGVKDLILHVGGAYGNKKEALKRWVEVYSSISENIRKLIRLENDERIFTIEDVIGLYVKTGVPVVFDYHHDRINPSLDRKEALTISINSWKNKYDPKIHISSGKNHKLDRSHHDFIKKEDYEELLSIVPHNLETKNNRLYIMLEAKMKEQALINVRH